MRWYGEAPDASIHMHEDPALIERLETLARDVPLSIVIETGTHLGTGSTKFVAEALQRSNPPKVFYTIEVNRENAMTAKANLARFPFVTPLWGSSVDIEDAALRMEQDPVLQNPYAFPEIWIDHVDQENAAKHYAVEVRGSSALGARPEWAGEDLLRILLERHKDEDPLIILDSAGGIGWYEFRCVLTTMYDRPYSLLLDDVQHIKHFRSLNVIREASEFEILYESRNAALAVHL